MAIGNCYLFGLTVFPYCFIIAHAVFAFAWMRKRGKILAGYAILAIGIWIALFLQMHMTHDELSVAFVSYLDERTANFRGLLILGIFLLLCATTVVMSDATYRRLTVFAVSASLLTALPFAAATQVQIHALHQSYAFQSLTWALLILALAERWWSNWTEFRKPKAIEDPPRPVSTSHVG